MKKEDFSWEKWLRIREARIQLVALEIAPADPDVTRWRAEAFADRDGRLLEDQEVEEWACHFEVDPIPDPSDDVEPDRWWIEARRVGLADTWTEASGEGFKVYPKPGNILDKGMRLAESLAARFGWSDASAARWLLTGILPTAPPIAKIFPAKNQQNVTAWREVVLRIPVEVPPDAVAVLYQSVRAGAISSLKGVPFVKNTPLSEKNLKATVFAAERSQSGDAWGDVFEQWTKHTKRQRKGKEWGYASTQSFIAAVHKTYKRLTGRKLQWKRKRGERK